MKFTVVSQNFAKALGVALKAVSPKASLPVLANVLLETDKGMLKITSTDLEKGIATWVGAKVESEGSVTIPAKVLADYFNATSSAQTVVTKEGNILSLSSEGNFAKISGISATEFPSLPEISPDSVFASVNAKAFCKGLSQVLFAAAASDARPILSGIYFGFLNKNLTFVALDGFRLCLKTVSGFEMEQKEVPPAIVVPAKSCLEAAKIFASSEGKIKIGFMAKDNIFFIQSNDIIFTSAVLDGEFPDYAKIIPTSAITKVTISKALFTQAFKSALVFADASSKIVKLAIKKEEQTVSLFSKTDEVGETKTDVKCEVVGEDLEIFFNSRFIADFLTNCASETVIFESNGPLAPSVFKEDTKDGMFCVLMPVKIASD